MPLAFLESPFRAFSLSRSRTRSRGPLASLRVRVRPLLRAACSGLSRPLSASSRPFAAARPCGLAGLRGREDVSSRPLRRSVVRAAKRVDRNRRSRPRRARLSAAGTPASKLCSPREVRARDSRPPCGERPPGRCSPGLLPLQSFPQLDSGFGPTPRLTNTQVPPRLMRLERPVARVVRELLAPTPGCYPPGSAGMHGRSTAHTTVGQRPVTSTALASAPPADRQPRPREQTERLARAPSRRRPTPPAPFTASFL